jgi:hypothetical protein
MSSLYGNNYTVVAANGQAPIDGPKQVNNTIVAAELARAAALAVPVAPAVTIPSSMCSSTIIVPPLIAGAGGVAPLTITLPNPAQNPGFYCKFVRGAGDVVNKIERVDCGAGLCNAILVRTGVNVAAAAAAQYIQFTGTAVAGDIIEVESNGVSYDVKAYSGVAAGVATA